MSAEERQLLLKDAETWLPEDLRQAVNSLSPQQREAVLLLHVLGYSEEEAAELLGIPIKIHIWRGIARLRLALDEPHLQ